MTSNPLESAIIDKSFVISAAQVHQAGGASEAARNAAVGILGGTASFTERAMGLKNSLTNVAFGIGIGEVVNDAAVGGMFALTGIAIGAIAGGPKGKGRA